MTVPGGIATKNPTANAEMIISIMFSIPKVFDLNLFLIQVHIFLCKKITNYSPIQPGIGYTFFTIKVEFVKNLDLTSLFCAALFKTTGF